MHYKDLSHAIALAACEFQGVTDKAGKPYILHCMKVLHKVMARTDDPFAHEAAVLHDVVEDTDVTVEGLADDYGWETTHLVALLSKNIRVIQNGLKYRYERLAPGEKLTDREYYTRIRGNAKATIIKLADLEHNSDIRRIKGATPKDFMRVQKYQKMYCYLSGRSEFPEDQGDEDESHLCVFHRDMTGTCFVCQSKA